VQVIPKFYPNKIYLVLQAFRQSYEISKWNITHFLINKKYVVKMVFDTSLKFAKKLYNCVFKIALFLFVFQFAATVVDCQDGSLVSGLLSSLEQPPKQLVDRLGQPAPNGGILRRHTGLRQHLYQMPQNDLVRMLDILSDPLHGEHLRTPDRLPQGHQVRRDQGHP